MTVHLKFHISHSGGWRVAGGGSDPPRLPARVCQAGTNCDAYAGDVQYVMTAIAAIIAAICGAAIGLLFTVAHHATVAIGDFDFPYGIVLGLASEIGFLVAMRLLWETRWPTVGGAVGLVAAILVLSLTGPGGSVIVRDDAFGWTWLVSAPIAALITIVWPRRRVRRHKAAPAESVGDDTIGEPEKPAKEYS